MNQYYLEHRSKERIGELQAEGLRSQAYQRSRPEKLGLFQGLRVLIQARLSSRSKNRERSAKSVRAETTYVEP